MERRSSALISRRSKSISDLSCLQSNRLQKPLSPAAGKVLQTLEVMSPLAGAAGRAIIHKVRKMRTRRNTCSDLGGIKQKVCFLPLRASLDSEEAAVARSGFSRLVYRKVRSMRSERDTPYKGLRDVASDVMRAVRICMHAKRFIALAKACTDSKTDLLSHRKTLHQVRFVVEPQYEVTVGEESHQEFADDNWKDLLADLSPVTPNVSHAAKATKVRPKRTKRKACNLKDFLVSHNLESKGKLAPLKLGETRSAPNFNGFGGDYDGTCMDGL